MLSYVPLTVLVLSIKSLRPQEQVTKFHCRRSGGVLETLVGVLRHYGIFLGVGYWL